MACSLSLCNSASAILEKGTRAGERRKKKHKTRCSHSRKLMGTSGGSDRAEGQPVSAQGVRAEPCARWLPGWLAWAQPLAPARPPGCAPAPLPLTAAPAAAAGRASRDVGPGQPLGGRAGPVLLLRPTSGPSLRPLGYAGPSDAAPRGSRRAGDLGAGGSGVVPKARTGSAPAGGRLGRGRTESR